MRLLIERNEKRAYRSLTDDRPFLFPELRQGEIVPLEVGLVQRIQFPYDGKLFEPLPAPDDFRVAIGQGFLFPLGGSFTLLDGDPLDYIPMASAIETDLNTDADITTAGGVTVTGSAGFYVITWNETGAQTLLTGDAGDLVPLSLLSIRRSVTGDVSTREVQTLRIYQNAGAIATLDTAAEAPGVSVDVVNAGGSGVNTQVRVIFSGDLYGGTWIFTAGASPADSEPLEFGWTAARLQAALESVGTIGSGNVRVKQESEAQYLVTFVGALAGTALAGIDVDGSGLLGINLLTGTLDLRAQGVDLLLADGSPLVTTFEVQSETTDGPSKILDQDVLLTGGIIESGMTDTTGGGGTGGSNVLHVDVIVTGGLIGADTIPVTFTGLTSAPTIIGTPYFIKSSSGEDNVAVGSLDSITSAGMNVNLLGLAVSGQTLRVNYTSND